MRDYKKELTGMFNRNSILINERDKLQQELIDSQDRELKLSKELNKTDTELKRTKEELKRLKSKLRRKGLSELI